MRIKHVHLVRFGPFEDYEVSFEHGLVGILGANGSGKTTLVNSIFATLTNDFSRFDGVKSDRIWDLAGDDDESYSEVEAEHEGVDFRIRRSLRPNKSTLWIGDSKPITKAGEIDRRLREQLGVDMKLIDDYVFVDQWKMFEFLDQTPAKRAEAFKHLCRTQQADTIHSVLSAVASEHALAEEVIDNSDELTTQIGEAEAELKALADKTTELKGMCLNVKSQVSAQRILDKRKRYEEAEDDIVQINPRIKDLLRDAKEARANHKTAEQQVAIWTKKKHKNKPFNDRAVKALEAWEAFEKKKRRKDFLEREIANIESDMEDLGDGPEKPEDFDRFEELQDELSDARMMQRTAHQVAGLREVLDNEDEDALCPTCHQVIDEDHVTPYEEMIPEHDKNVSEIKARIGAIKDYKQAVRVLEKKSAALTANLDARQEELDQMEEDDTPEFDRDEAERIVADYEDLLDRVEKKEQHLKKADRALSDLKIRIEEMENQAARINQKLKDNEVKQELFERANERLVEHRAAEMEINRIEGQAEEIQETLDERKAELKKLKAILKKRRKLLKAVKVMESTRDVFHWSQLPNVVAQGNLVQMEDGINEVLHWFDDPFWVEADENLGFQAHLPGHPPRRAEGLSGGQKVVFAIGMRYAVSDLFGADIGCLFLDEPTAALDDEKLDAFVDVLLRLAAEVRGKRQLCVVTHAPELKKAFDQVIEVTRC